MWNNMAMLLGTLGRTSNALEAYDTAFACPDYQFLDNEVKAGILAAKASIFNVMKQYEKAKKICDEAIGLNPKCAIAWSNKSHSFIGLEDYPRALIAAEKALKIDRNLYLAWLNKGDALFNMGNLVEAEKDYIKAMEFCSVNVLGGILTRLVDVQLKLGKSEDALVSIDKALQRSPNNAVFLNNKGYILLKLNKYEPSLRAFEKAIRINPQFANAWCNMGLALSYLYMFDKALTSYDKAIELNSQYAEAWFGKGSILLVLKRFPDAIDAYQNFIKSARPQDDKNVQWAKMQIRKLQGAINKQK